MPPEPLSDAISRAIDRVPVAWRNAGGWTSTVAVAPPAATMDDFDWRVSIATIAGDSDFSEFTGIDRYLVPLSAGGLDLSIDGSAQHVGQYEVCSFAGSEGTNVLTLAHRNAMMVTPGRSRTLRGGAIVALATMALTGSPSAPVP